MERAKRAVELAEALLREARAGQTAEERARAERLARLMEDPRGKELTIALTDQCFRSRRPERIADQLHYLLERYGAPRFMEWWERIGLTLGAVMGHYLPSLVVPPIVARLRHETESLILPGEDADLRRYLAARRADGIRLNLNQLGEAILGEEEAARRLEAYLALLAREDVEYISVKVSSVSSQLDLSAFRHTVEVVKDRLRALYRQALRHHYRHPDGRVTPKFVNLDMEEYRDLDLTVIAFREVLDEAEFMALPAGIVLQAYLPESHRVQRGLVAWAIARCARGGAPIKLRVVKGANLAMERIEADLHGWPQAPFTNKLEVDANFKRMIEYGCRPEHARAVHLGIASHNLFDVAHGLVLREERGVAAWVEFEMLEGMANHQARVVQARAGGLLLYAPVVRAEDFHSAIAYLVRRLDENTAPDNFLRHVFGLEPGSPDWDLERDRFLGAFDLLEELSDAPRRTQDRGAEAVSKPAPGDPSASFANEPDTDWAVAASREWIDRVRAEWRERPAETVPLQIAGELVAGAVQVEGRDRSEPARIAYRHGLADRAQVSRALDAARAAQAAWGGRPAAERRRLLEAAAGALARRRGDLVGAMIVDGAKTATEADPEVSEAIDFARYYARALGAGDTVDGYRLEALGVVVVAPPWNFPLSIPAGGVLAALAAGNAVLLKPALEAVLVGWHLAGALWEAGIPRDVVQFVPCPDDEIGRGLITDPRVDAVILTGSVETARRFLEWRPDLRAVRGDERQERDHRHRAGGPRPGRARSRALGLRPQRPEVLGGQPRDLRGGGLRRPRVPPAAPRRGGEPRGGQRLGSREPRDPADPAAGPRAPARAHHAGRGRGVAARAAIAEPRGATLVAGHQAGRAARLLLPPDRVLRAGAGAHARRGSRRGHRAGERSAVRAHQRDRVARRSRGRALARADRGRLPLRQPPHHRGHRRPPALRGLEGLVGGPGRQGRRAELRAPALPRAPDRIARRRTRGGAARGRGQLRARLAGAFLPGARADPPARRAQRVPVPPVPARARAGRGGHPGRSARARAGAARRAHVRRAGDGEPGGR